MAVKSSEIIEIKPIEIQKFNIRIVGDSPLIVHAWSEKAKREMLEAQQGKSKGKKKDPKNPVYDFVQSLYWAEGKPDVNCYMPEEDVERAFCRSR